MLRAVKSDPRSQARSPLSPQIPCILFEVVLEQVIVLVRASHFEVIRARPLGLALNLMPAIDHFFDDEAVPGTQGIEVALLRGVEPFPTKELVPYDTAYLAGFVVEHYQVVLVDAVRRSRESTHQPRVRPHRRGSTGSAEGLR